MAHFAQLSGSIVQQVIVVDNNIITNGSQEVEQLGVDFCKSIFGSDTEWKQTSYNNELRGSFAGTGFTYNSTLNAFISPKPYTSWILNTGSYQWDPPTPIPEQINDERYYWNEDELRWDS